jgi:hypothetical protein
MRIGLVLILILLFLSCKKDNQANLNESFLKGIWYSEQTNTQYTIKNLSGSGNLISFTKITNNGKDYLQVIIGGSKTTYEIKYIDDHKMILVDSANEETTFIKIAKVLG